MQAGRIAAAATFEERASGRRVRRNASKVSKMLLTSVTYNRARVPTSREARLPARSCSALIERDGREAVQIGRPPAQPMLSSDCRRDALPHRTQVLRHDLQPRLSWFVALQIHHNAQGQVSFEAGQAYSKFHSVALMSNWRPAATSPYATTGAPR